MAIHTIEPDARTLHYDFSREREPIVEIDTGDVVWTPDGEEHWHGAAPAHFMTHLSITEGAPTWGDHVTDADYRGDTTT